MVVSLAALFEAQDGRCRYCRVQMTKKAHRGHSITRDHIVPKVHGGTNERRNLVGACRRCNSLKDDMSESEFRRWYPRPDLIEAASPMVGFDVRVSKRPTHAPLPRRLTAVERGWGDPEAAWQARRAVFAVPVRPLAPQACSTCRWYGALGAGCAPICRLRWAALPFALTPFTGPGEVCGAWERG